MSDCFVQFAADAAAAAGLVVAVVVLAVAVADYKNVASVSVSNSSRHQPAKRRRISVIKIDQISMDLCLVQILILNPHLFLSIYNY